MGERSIGMVFLVLLVAACPKQNGSDATPAQLAITVSPSALDLYTSDASDTQITITNNGGQMSGTPTLQVVGLTLGTMTFTSNTCTTGLAPSASCTATGQVVETTKGPIDFQITASASPGGTDMTTMSLSVTCPAVCGPNQATDCCASSVVPGNATGATLAGASFYRTYDVAGDQYSGDRSSPASVSDFRLDTYLVTVGRFRAFVNAGMGTQAGPPTSGAGARMLNGITNQGGWDPASNINLAINTTALVAAVKCEVAHQTWTDTLGSNENMPINCVTWFEAMAFCIWDGGYLPTEAEWNYAASGGSEQRAYPWSSPASSLTVDCTYANYDIDIPSGTHCVNGTGAANRVGGESPNGDSKWGQSDQGGNVYEWVLDSFALQYPTTTCNDCANLAATSTRVLRGGSFFDAAFTLRAGWRIGGREPSLTSVSVGFRCARRP